jgi:hypothetical protein
LGDTKAGGRLLHSRPARLKLCVEKLQHSRPAARLDQPAQQKRHNSNTGGLKAVDTFLAVRQKGHFTDGMTHVVLAAASPAK